MPGAVRCPICHRLVSFDDPYMPFCSDRCRIIDLGNWASEKYSVPSMGHDELEDLEVPDDEDA
jgi:hypothetical protein